MNFGTPLASTAPASMALAGCMALGARGALESTALRTSWALERMTLGDGWVPASMALETDWTLVIEVLTLFALVCVTLGIEAQLEAPTVAIRVEWVGPSPALARVTPLGARGPQVVLYSVTAAVASKMTSPFRGSADPHGSSL